jgi:hypothetical protein
VENVIKNMGSVKKSIDSYEREYEKNCPKEIKQENCVKTQERNKFLQEIKDMKARELNLSMKENLLGNNSNFDILQ